MFYLSCVAINIKDHVPCNFLLVTKLRDSTVRNFIKLKQSFVLFYSFETIKIQTVEYVQNGFYTHHNISCWYFIRIQQASCKKCDRKWRNFGIVSSHMLDKQSFALNVCSHSFLLHLKHGSKSLLTRYLQIKRLNNQVNPQELSWRSHEILVWSLSLLQACSHTIL